MAAFLYSYITTKLKGKLNKMNQLQKMLQEAITASVTNAVQKRSNTISTSDAKSLLGIFDQKEEPEENYIDPEIGENITEKKPAQKKQTKTGDTEISLEISSAKTGKMNNGWWAITGRVVKIKNNENDSVKLFCGDYINATGVIGTFTPECGSIVNITGRPIIDKWNRKSFEIKSIKLDFGDDSLLANMSLLLNNHSLANKILAEYKDRVRDMNANTLEEISNKFDLDKNQTEALQQVSSKDFIKEFKAKFPELKDDIPVIMLKYQTSACTLEEKFAKDPYKLAYDLEEHITADLSQPVMTFKAIDKIARTRLNVGKFNTHRICAAFRVAMQKNKTDEYLDLDDKNSILDTRKAVGEMLGFEITDKIFECVITALKVNEAGKYPIMIRKNHLYITDMLTACDKIRTMLK